MLMRETEIACSDRHYQSGISGHTLAGLIFACSTLVYVKH